MALCCRFDTSKVAAETSIVGDLVDGLYEGHGGSGRYRILVVRQRVIQFLADGSIRAVAADSGMYVTRCPAGTEITIEQNDV